MVSKFTFWIWGAVVSQLLSAAFHSISFFIKPEPEKELHNLMTNYKMDMGAGISRSFADIFLSLSICFTLICILGGISNWYMKKKNISADIWKGLVLIESVIFGIFFWVMLKFTFLPPIICTGAIFFFLLGAYFTNKTARQ